MKKYNEVGFNDEFDLETLLIIFLNKADALLKIFLISLFFLVLFYIFQDRVYQSFTQLQFNKANSISSMMPSLSSSQGDRSIGNFEPEKAIFRSRNNIFKAIELLGDKIEENSLEENSILEGISFSDDKQLLTIYFTSNYKDLNKQILESLTESFIEDNINQKANSAKKAIDFINEEIPKIQTKLSEAEEKLTKFQKSGDQSLILDQENRGNKIISLKGDIKSIELKEIELKEFYKPSHPIYTTLVQQKEILQNELNEIEKGILNVPTEQRQLSNYKQKVKILSTSIEELEKSRLDLSISAASNISNIRIITPATDSKKIRPTFYLLLLSFGVTFLFYIIFLIQHFFTDKIMSIEALTDFLEERHLFLGAFPLIKNKDLQDRILIEAEKNFLDRIVVKLFNSKSKIYLVSSNFANAGKSYFIKKLANELKNTSKVAIVDLDTRKKGVSYSDEFLKENLSIEDYLNDSIDDRNFLVLKNNQEKNPIKSFTSPKMNTLFDKLRNNFEVILIDSPPLNPFVDSKLLLQFSDEVICILESHESSFREIENFKREIFEDFDQSYPISFFLNKVRLHLEILSFKFRYPLYDYGYLYSYPQSDGNIKNFVKILKIYASITKKYFFTAYESYKKFKFFKK